MARIVKEQAYAVKRNEILDVAQRLVYTKGYEQMTIQDILDDLQISKGAFYHYFDSKQALLEALIERMLQEGIQLITPIVHDPHMPALEKLQRYFATVARYKTTQESVFSTPFPDQAGEVVLSILLNLADSLAELLLSCVPYQDALQRLERTVAAYSDALECVLR